MLRWLRFSSAKRAATSGPNADRIPARKKLIRATPFTHVLEGDGLIALDTMIAIFLPAVALHCKIYEQFSNGRS
jgi:hypothetical protein